MTLHGATDTSASDAETSTTVDPPSIQPDESTQPTLRRAVMLMTASSFMIPAAGVLTAPLLARTLGTDGRGELTAALAPAALILAVATLGLPDSLTYHVAKRPEHVRRSVLLASLITVALGAGCLVAVYLLAPVLASGDPGLERLIVLAGVLTIPALVVNVFRGAAIGRQMWLAVAIERTLNSSLRVVLFVVFALLGALTTTTALVISTLIPIVVGVVYLSLMRRHPAPLAEETDAPQPFRDIASFGSRVWLGSIASMLLARSDQVLMAPLSSTRDLGLYSVATTISDLPIVVSLAVQGALFGVNSETKDAANLTSAARLTNLVTFVGCAVLSLSLPFWIGPLFGHEFTAALVPTWMLIASALICIPGLMAATGLSAWGRPGIRSAGLAVAFLVNVGAMFALVPSFGVLGACVASLGSNLVLSTFMVLRARSVMGVRGRDFVLVDRADIRRSVVLLRTVRDRLPLTRRNPSTRSEDLR